MKREVKVRKHKKNLDGNSTEWQEHSRTITNKKATNGNSNNSLSTYPKNINGWILSNDTEFKLYIKTSNNKDNTIEIDNSNDDSEVIISDKGNIISKEFKSEKLARDYAFKYMGYKKTSIPKKEPKVLPVKKEYKHLKSTPKEIIKLKPKKEDKVNIEKLLNFNSISIEIYNEVKNRNNELINKWFINNPIKKKDGNMKSEKILNQLIKDLNYLDIKKNKEYILQGILKEKIIFKDIDIKKRRIIYKNNNKQKLDRYVEIKLWEEILKEIKPYIQQQSQEKQPKQEKTENSKYQHIPLTDNKEDDKKSQVATDLLLSNIILLYYDKNSNITKKEIDDYINYKYNSSINELFTYSMFETIDNTFKNKYKNNLNNVKEMINFSNYLGVNINLKQKILDWKNKKTKKLIEKEKEKEIKKENLKKKEKEKEKHKSLPIVTSINNIPVPKNVKIGLSNAKKKKDKFGRIIYMLAYLKRDNGILGKTEVQYYYDDINEVAYQKSVSYSTYGIIGNDTTSYSKYYGDSMCYNRKTKKYEICDTLFNKGDIMSSDVNVWEKETKNKFY